MTSLQASRRSRPTERSARSTPRVAGPRARAASGTLAAVWAACSFAPAPETPAPVAEMPERFSEAAVGGAYEPLRWWETFNDPELERTVEAALAANLDLRQAVARVEELRSRYRIARAPLFPSIGLTADVTRSSTPANTGLGGQIVGDDAEAGGADGAPPDTSGTGFGFTFPDRFDFTTYSASLGFAYELDFWGRARNEKGAAMSDFLATRADLETVRLGVIASTASTYFEILELRKRVALAEENVDLLRDRTELTDQRYLRGLVSTFELYSIRQAYRTAQSELPGLRTALYDAEGRLALLLGRYAGDPAALIDPDAEPTLDLEPIPAGLPVSLLELRPDVFAAAERMDAARRRVGARRAELLPRLSLSGSAGFQASEPADLFRADQWFASFLGSLFAPIFQGGALRAAVGVAEAQYEQLAVAYVRTVLTAFKEVQTSLRAFDNERERYARVRDQLDEAEASAALQLRRYRRGIGDYVSYLDAQRNLVSARTLFAGAERAMAEARLAVHRALGGAWIQPDPANQTSTSMANDGGRAR